MTNNYAAERMPEAEESPAFKKGDAVRFQGRPYYFLGELGVSYYLVPMLAAERRQRRDVVFIPANQKKDVCPDPSRKPSAGLDLNLKDLRVDLQIGDPVIVDRHTWGGKLNVVAETFNHAQRGMMFRITNETSCFNAWVERSGLRLDRQRYREMHHAVL